MEAKKGPAGNAIGSRQASIKKLLNENLKDESMEIEVGYQACIHPDMVSQHGRRLVEPVGRRAEFWA